MRIVLISGLVLLTASTAFARTLYFAGGLIDSPRYRDSSYSWQIAYMEHIADHFAWSFSWLNEGHFPGHHRDGQNLQLWLNCHPLDKRLSLAAGAGPYLYYDTQATGTGRYRDAHELGAIFSLAASWHIHGPWLFRICANHVWAHHDINTDAILAGIGYQLSLPSPTPDSASYTGSTCITQKKNEITLYYGCSILNSFKSQTSPAAEIEYRHEIIRQLEYSIGFLHEGDPYLSRRNGFVAQIWPTRSFCSERLTFGVGLGAYLALDQRRHRVPGESGSQALSGLVTMTVSYDINPQFRIRLSWNRIVTNFDRDTDVIMAGVGYHL